MKDSIGRILLAGLLGGVAIGVAAYHAMQIYLVEGDKEDPIKEVPEPEEPSQE